MKMKLPEISFTLLECKILDCDDLKSCKFNSVCGGSGERNINNLSNYDERRFIPPPRSYINFSSQEFY